MSSEKGSSRRSNITWMFPLLLIAALAASYWTIPSFGQFVERLVSLLQTGDLGGLRQWINSYGGWGPVVIFLSMLLQTLLAFIPSTLIIVAAVISYGPIQGGLLAWTGLITASVLGYVIGRSLGPHTVRRLIGKQSGEKVEHLVDRYGVWAIVAARLSPVLSTDAVSFGAGLVQMNFYEFLAATAGGLFPLVALIGYFGSEYQRLDDGLVWISAGSLALFIGYVVYDRYVRS